MKKIIQIFIMLMILPMSGIIQASATGTPQDLLNLLLSIKNGSNRSQPTSPALSSSGDDNDMPPLTSTSNNDDDVNVSDNFEAFPDTDEDDDDDNGTTNPFASDEDDDDDEEEPTNEEKFIQAAMNDDIEGINETLQDGVDINTVAYGYTALQAAALSRSENAIRTLVEAGADKTITNTDGKTAYDLTENDSGMNAAVKESLKPDPTDDNDNDSFEGINLDELDFERTANAEESARLARVAEENAARAARAATEQATTINNDNDDTENSDDEYGWFSMGLPESWGDDPYDGQLY